MQSFIHSVLQSTEFPLLTALLLGLLVALNPCQIAICMSALASFVQKDTDERHFMRNAWLFALGRATLYFILAMVLVLLVRFTGSTFDAHLFDGLTEWVERLLPLILLLVGFFFVYRGFHKHHHSDSCHNSGNVIRKNKAAGVFVLGIVLALLFCPESALVYFGMLIPLAVSTESVLPLFVFTISAVAPLLMVAYICKLSLKKTRQLERKLTKLQVWINFATGVLLILLALFLWFFE